MFTLQTIRELGIVYFNITLEIWYDVAKSTFSYNQVDLQTVVIKIHNGEIDVIIATYLFFTDVYFHLCTKLSILPYSMFSSDILLRDYKTECTSLATMICCTTKICVYTMTKDFNLSTNYHLIDYSIISFNYRQLECKCSSVLSHSLLFIYAIWALIDINLRSMWQFLPLSWRNLYHACL